MTGSHGSDEPTVLIAREAYRELLRASRRNVRLAYAAGGLALWAAVVLAITAGSLALWAGLFAIAAVAFVAWGVLTARRLTRLYGPPGVTPASGPFSPIPYVDRQGSMWREGGGGAGSIPEAGSDIPAPTRLGSNCGYGPEEPMPSPTNSTQLRLNRLFPP